jgi:hypothetical protein
MPADVEHLKARARDCRVLSKDARDARNRSLLAELAEELDAEATRMETEEVAEPKL